MLFEDALDSANMAFIMKETFDAWDEERKVSVVATPQLLRLSDCNRQAVTNNVSFLSNLSICLFILI